MASRDEQQVPWVAPALEMYPVEGGQSESSPLAPGVNSPDSAGYVFGVPARDPQQDARRHPRTKCFLAVELRTETDAGLLIGNLSDVSLGGCCVETTHMLERGSTLVISPLDSNGSLWVRGVTVNARMGEGAANFKIGVQFVDGDSTTELLQQFLQFVADSAARKTPDQSSLYLRWMHGR